MPSPTGSRTRRTTTNYRLVWGWLTGRRGTVQEPDIWPSYWIQDNDGKRLVHKRDNQTVVYLFEHYSYWVRYDKKGEIVVSPALLISNIGFRPVNTTT